MLEARNITKSYDRLTVVSDVSLSVAEGEIVAITGPSGAGKTTLLQIVGTLDRPDSGEVVYDGRDVARLSDVAMARFRNRNIGFVFQQHQLLPEFTLLENVMMPALIARMRRSEAADKARRLIERLGIGHRLNHKPSQLSGGECQRASVARALVNGPRLVLADEPSGSLDSDNRQSLHRLFFDLRRELGQTFVIVTHDESLAADADRIIRMRDGRIESTLINPLPIR